MIRAGLLALIFFSQLSVAETALSFTNIKGWKVEAVNSDPALQALFGNSQYVFFVEDQEAEELPIIRARELAKAGRLNVKSEASWKEHVFFDKSRSQILTAQRVFKKGPQPYYVAEFQTDTGGSTMLHSILLATVVDSKIQILIYEQHRDIYQKNIAKIKELFQKVTITKAR